MQGLFRLRVFYSICEVLLYLVFLGVVYEHDNTVQYDNTCTSSLRLLDRLLLCSSYAELLLKLHNHELSLKFDEEEDFFESVMIVQDPWRIILEDIQILEPTNSSLNNLDIWMAPEICNSFLLPKDKEAKLLLTEIHKQCRDKDPEKRPNALKLFKSYKDVAQKLQLSQMSE